MIDINSVEEPMSIVSNDDGTGWVGGVRGITHQVWNLPDICT